MKRAALLVPVAVLAAAGCAGGASGGASAEASCSGVVTYDGRDYLPTEKSLFTLGARLGTVTVPECDDTPNDAEAGTPERTTGVYAIEGIDPAEAVAVGDGPAEAAPMAAR